MKLFCSQKDLSYALNTVNKAISPNNTLPVLNNILLKASNKKLFLSATNLELAISLFIDADVRNEGAITIPARLITNYVSLLKNEQIELSLTEGLTLSIKSAQSETKMKGINADEFPLIPKIENPKNIKISTQELNKAITRTVFAVSQNPAKPVLSGVNFIVEKDVLKIVATDSYRLAEQKLKLKDRAEFSLQSIVPARTIQELGKVLTKNEEKEVMIEFSQSQILFKIGETELTSRLIEGSFPAYEKIFPKANKTKIEVGIEDLAQTVRRVSLFARENNNNIKLAATNDGKLLISTDETKIGEEKAELSIGITGENNKIALNAQYLSDVLSYIDSEKVVIELNDKLSPAVIMPCKEEGYMYIIMPLKI
ncbi:DNA polymerase III subunit beta [bacterium]|nr:DNA polymerase III subunit beta [bacterium]